MDQKVKKAILNVDRRLLSELGRRGTMARVKKERIRKEKLQIQLAECDEIARQANEHICPVDD